MIIKVKCSGCIHRIDLTPGEPIKLFDHGELESAVSRLSGHQSKCEKIRAWLRERLNKAVLIEPSVKEIAEELGVSASNAKVIAAFISENKERRYQRRDNRIENTDLVLLSDLDLYKRAREATYDKTVLRQRFMPWYINRRGLVYRLAKHYGLHPVSIKVRAGGIQGAIRLYTREIEGKELLVQLPSEAVDCVHLNGNKLHIGSCVAELPDIEFKHSKHWNLYESKCA